MSVSLGIGLTNDCNLRCPHCYRPGPPVRHLPAAEVRAVCEALDPAGVNLGTGENALHPQFPRIVRWLLDRGLPVSLTSNGFSVAALSDRLLRRLHDVEVSIDFPDRARFDAFRGQGAWSMAVRALERCATLDVPTTVLAVLMNANARDLVPLARLAASFGAPLRVNVYQPVHGSRFAPSWEEFWRAVGDLLADTTLLACTEPVVAAAAGLPSDGPRCGRASVRVTPGGEVLPCVYWPRPTGKARELAADPRAILDGPGFRQLALTPPECAACEHEAVCGGGCAGRRALCGGLDRPDPYCPKRGHLPRPIVARPGGAADRLHVENVCTLLVDGRC